VKESRQNTIEDDPYSQSAEKPDLTSESIVDIPTLAMGDEFSAKIAVMQSRLEKNINKNA